jgi:PAT family acetyl-CoA transporter-like MFS transporter 1
MFKGLPFGLVWSVPLILSSRKVSYTDQGTFSFASWPFALKILWAPLVDSLYVKRIGRRRTWVLGCIFLSGLLMLSLANYVNELLDPTRIRRSQDIYILTAIFGTFVFLSATEDITLDGWALELLLSYTFNTKKVSISNLP